MHIELITELRYPKLLSAKNLKKKFSLYPERKKTFDHFDDNAKKCKSIWNLVIVLGHFEYIECSFSQRYSHRGRIGTIIQAEVGDVVYFNFKIP